MWTGSEITQTLTKKLVKLFGFKEALKFVTLTCLLYDFTWAQPIQRLLTFFFYFFFATQLFLLGKKDEPTTAIELVVSVSKNASLLPKKAFMECGSELLDCTQTATGKVKSAEWSLPTFESGSETLQSHIFKKCLHVLGGFVIKNSLNRTCRSLF